MASKPKSKTKLLTKAEQEKMIQEVVVLRSQVEGLLDFIKAKDEIISALQADLETSDKIQDEIIEEVNKFLKASEDGFESITTYTGEITYNDVLYHIHFLARTLNHKFGVKEDK